MSNRTNNATIQDLAAWAILGAMAACQAPQSFACEFIQEDNKRLQKEIKAQEAMLLKFEATIQQVETACKTDQLAFSQLAAKAAGAESCVALKENAAMTGTLSQKSITCASQVHKATVFMQTFISDEIAPMEEGLDAAVELDKSLTALQQYCGKELQGTRKLREKAGAVLQRSISSTSQAKVDLGNFQAFAETMQAASNKTAQAHERCNSDRGAGTESLMAAVKNGVGQGTGAVAGLVPVPSGKSENGESTVTGRIRKDQLSSGETARIREEKLGAPEPAIARLPSLAQSKERGFNVADGWNGQVASQSGSTIVSGQRVTGEILKSFSGELAQNAAQHGAGGKAESENFSGSRQPAQEGQASLGGAGAVAQLVLDSGSQEPGAEAVERAAQASSSDALSAGAGMAGEPAESQGQASPEAAASLPASEMSLFARVHAKYRKSERSMAAQREEKKGEKVKFLGELSPGYVAALGR